MRLSRFARLGGALLSCALMLGNNREAVAQRGVPIQDDVNAVDFSRLGLKRGVLLKLPVDVTPGRSMDATLPIDGVERTIKLDPYSVRAPGFKLVEVKGAVQQEIDPGPVNTLRGHVVKDPGSIAAGGVMPDGLYLTIVLADGRQFWLEPVNARVPGLPAGTHVLYTQEDVLQGLGFCGTDEVLHGVHDPGTGTTRANTHYTAEVAVEADFEYYNRYGSTFLVSSRVAIVYNVVNVQYERDVDIRHTIVATFVQTAEPDPYTTNSINTTLDEMRAFWNANRSGTGRDIAHLFTGKPTGGTIGLAWVGVVCDSLTAGFGYGVSQVDFNAGNLSSAADLVAHETGHNWNACHCTCSSPPFTMNPFITSINRFGTTADQCATNSIAAIVGHRNTRGCLNANVGTSDPPLNDACSAAVPIGPGTWGFGNVGATNDGPAACAPAGADIWYYYDSAYDGTVTVSTCGTHDMNGVDTGLDTVLAVYTGACGSFTQVACNDDNVGECGGLDAGVRRDSYLQFTMTRGTRYYIRLCGYNGATGNGLLNLSESGCSTPVNDSCGNATPILDGTYSFSTICATTDGFVDSACNFFSYLQTGSDIWYSYTPQCSGNVTVSLCGSSFDTKVAVYAGSCPGSQNLAIACNDDSCGAQSSVTFAATAGASYRIRIGGYNGVQGVGVFSVSNATCPVPANDNCASAIDVSSGGTWTGHLAGATNDNAVATCGSSTANRDVWYRFTACAPVVATFSTCGTHDTGGVDLGMDSVLSVFDTCGGTLLACNDDNFFQCGGADANIQRDSFVSVSIGAGETRLIRLSHYGLSTPGPFTFNVSFVPANDACAGALNAFNGVNPFCTYGATDSGILESCLFGSQPYKDVWFAYTAGATTLVRVSTCDPATFYDTMVTVYAGSCPAGNDTAIACNDDDFSCGYIRASTLTFAASSGSTYFIRVGGFAPSTGTGPGALVITPICPADVDDGSGTGTPDGGVDINDLLYFLAQYEAGLAPADLDDGSGTGTPDGGVDINDLLFFLTHYEAGC